jgi:hypothetical protein
MAPGRMWWACEVWRSSANVCSTAGVNRWLRNQQRRLDRRQVLLRGSEELRMIGSGVPGWRIDVLVEDGRTVVLEGGSVVLVIADWRREQMIRYVRAFDRYRLLLLADLLDVASRHELPSPVAERLVTFAEGVSGIDTALRPPKRGLGPYRDATTGAPGAVVPVDPER